MTREHDDMKTLPQTKDRLMATLAHHDAQITSLGGRMTGIENSVRTLHGEVHSGFTAINQQISVLVSKIDKMDAAPKFDFHKTVSTVTTIAVLFSMIVGGIIWITTGQFSGAWSKQDAFNAQITRRVEANEEAMQRIHGWTPAVERKR